MRDDEKLLTIHDVARICSVSTRQIEKLVAAGRWPRPIRLGCGRGARRWHWETARRALAELAGLEVAAPDPAQAKPRRGRPAKKLTTG